MKGRSVPVETKMRVNPSSLESVARCAVTSTFNYQKRASRDGCSVR